MCQGTPWKNHRTNETNHLYQRRKETSIATLINPNISTLRGESWDQRRNTDTISGPLVVETVFKVSAHYLQNMSARLSSIMSAKLSTRAYLCVFVRLSANMFIRLSLNVSGLWMDIRGFNWEYRFLCRESYILNKQKQKNRSPQNV